MLITRRVFLRSGLIAAAGLASCGLPGQTQPETATPNLDGRVDVILEGLDEPDGIAFDPTGRLWCAEKGAGYLVRFDEGKMSRVSVGGAPAGLAFDARGRAWVADPQRNIIFRFDPYTKVWEIMLDQINGKPLQSPDDLAFDSEGSLLFSCPNLTNDNRDGYIACLQPDGSAKQIGAGYIRPSGLDFVSKGKALIVADTAQKKIFKGIWDSDLAAWFDPRPWVESDSANGPDGIYPGDDGLIYQAAPGDGAVIVFDASGATTRRINVPGSRPVNLTVDPSGKLGLVVVEAETGKVISYPDIQPGANIYNGGNAW